MPACCSGYIRSAMRLIALNFSENNDTPQEWVLKDLELGAKNLLVGKNSSGKSRTLNVIHALSRFLSGLNPLSRSGSYDCLFDDEGVSYRYELEYINQEVVKEKITRDTQVLLDRGQEGAGKIFSEKIEGGMFIEFQAPSKDLAAVSRRDSIQHSFIEPLYIWASSLRYYPFGTSLGKEGFVIVSPNGPSVDDRDFNSVVGIFREGLKSFNDEFKSLIINDLKEIDYHVDDVGVGSPVSITFQGVPGEPVGLFVKETELPGITDQHSMSQGMFRVLSLIIQVNYFVLKGTASTILIDDIGEGLDFDRSCRLIELLRRKADESKLQVLLSTNDRFVMNKVPLAEWSIMQRKGNIVSVKNYKNSKEIFDDFKFTGLSNFSFLEFDYLNDQQ